MSEPTRRLNATLYFGLDGQARNKLNRDLDALKKELKSLESEAARLEKALSEANDPAEAKKLKGELNQVHREIEQTARAVDGRLNQAFQETERQINNVRKTADGLSQVGQSMAMIGGGMIAPFLLAANSYVQVAGRADQASRDWLDQQKRLEQAQLRIGRVAAQSIVPVMETLAGLAEDAADFAEKHPDAIKAVLGIGGTLVAIGGATATIGKAVQVISTVKGGLLALAKLGSAGATASAAGSAAAGAGGAGAAGAAGAAGLTAGGIAASVLGGVALGGAVYQGIATSKVGKQMGLANVQQYASVAAYGLGKLVGGTETANRWFVKVAGGLGQLDEATRKAAEAQVQAASNATAGAGGRVISQAAVDTFIQYRKAQDSALEQYEKNRARIIGSYEKQRTKAVADFAKSQAKSQTNFDKTEQREQQQYERNRQKMLADYAKSEQRAEQDYYRQRVQASKQYGVEVQRAEQDHRREMRRMRQDYERSQQDAIADRDALAYFQNQQRYEDERQQAEEDYQVEAARRSEEFAAQVAEMEAQFAEARAQRQADFAERMTEAQAQFEEQRALRAEQFAEQMEEARQAHQKRLAEMDQTQQDELAAAEQGYREQLATLETSLAEQLAALDENLLGEQALRNQYYAQMTTDLEAWLAGNARAMREQVYTTGGSTSSGSGWTATRDRRSKYARAIGGYAGSGLYRLGEEGREFVLSNQTTRAMERMVGGSLTQQNVISGGRHDTMTIRVDAGAYNAVIVPVVERAVEQFARQVIVQIQAA